MHKNVWILTVAQALMMSMNSLNIFVGGLVGSELAPTERLTTLPVASTVVGTALSTIPITMLMKRMGRKNTFLLVSILSLFISLAAAYSISIQNFILLIICTFLLGINSATLMQYRFAAMESVSMNQIPKAASIVLVGGIAAAFIGPEIAVWGKDLLSVDFSGSYVLLSGLFAFGFITLLSYQNTTIASAELEDQERPLTEILAQPTLWLAIMGATVGYAIMTFVMTATPVSMHVMDGHTLSDTKWVIQSHIIAMFLPSLFTGWLIQRFGAVRLMVTGLIIYVACVGIGFAGHHFMHYWWALLLLGLGWNFLFVSGTSLLPMAYRPSERYKVQGINEITVFGSQALASLSAGWIIFSWGWEKLLLLTLPFIILQIVIILWWRSKKTT
jgi:MFS family permease